MYIPQPAAITKTNVSPSKRTMFSPREVASPYQKDSTNSNSFDRFLKSVRSLVIKKAKYAKKFP